MTLRGPADADHYRVKVGRYHDRWYVDPLPGCRIAQAAPDWQAPSVSTVKKGGDGKDWSFVALKRVAEAIVAGETFQPGAQWGTIYDRLKSINQRGLEQAGVRGTNVHTYFERGLRGQPIEAFDPNEPGANYLPAVRAFFDQYQPELVAVEVVALNRTLNGVGYGGTGDAIIRIDGKTYWPDWKSRGEDSDHGAYPEEGAQLGGYAHADYLIVENTHGPTRIAVPELDGGLIVSVKPDGCRIYPVDLDVAGEHWAELHRWWTVRQHEREAIGKPWAPRKVAAPTVSPVVESPAPVGVEERATPTDRRRRLLARFMELTNEDQDRFRALNINRDDLDAVEQALNSIDPFANSGSDQPTVEGAESDKGAGGVLDGAGLKPGPERLRRFTPSSMNTTPPALPTPPVRVWADDEGDPVDDATFETLEQLFFDLDEPARMWIHRIITEASQAGVPFIANRSVGRRTTRRYELYRGLLALAAGGIGEDELVRDLIATVLYSDAPFDPRCTVGHCVGSLTTVQAEAFAVLCKRAVNRPELLDLRDRPVTA